MARIINVICIFIFLTAAFPLAAADALKEPIQTLPTYEELDDASFYIPLRDRNGYIQWRLREEISLKRALWSVENPDRRAELKLKAAVEAAISGPARYERDEGLQPAFPPGMMIDRVRVQGERGGYYVTLPVDYLSALTDESAQELVELFLGVSYNVPTIRHHMLLVRSAGEIEYQGLNHYLPTPSPISQKPSESEEDGFTRAVGQPPAPGQGQPSGYLSGKSIFLSPGHGWTYNTTLGRWATQRGNTYNIIEDLSNTEAVNTYLTHYLFNAGAGVYTCRERDFNINMVIVDNGDSGYSETGTWSDVTHADAFDGNYRRAVTNPTETATATFTPDIPESGYYRVYIWYVGGSSNASDTMVTVNHTGGSTPILRDMEVDGYTWRDLSLFHFDAGTNPLKGSVVISNASGESSNYVVADAVRFGGGIGESTPFSDPFPSGWPRIEESGRYHANFMGCQVADCGTSTVSAMPRYAAWESESWEDSVYVSWHTNAPEGGYGTSSFAYTNGSSWNDPFAGVEGGLELRDAIHNELINDIRAGYDASWTNRGTYTANFGEINPSNNSEMPASLHEMAFHATASDSLALQNPVFRMIVSRAVYQGIVKYYAQRDGDPGYTLLPEPPTGLRITNNGSGGVSIAWDPPVYDTGAGLYGDAATGYKVYKSSDGFGFNNGTVVTGTTLTDTSVSEGSLAYYRVTATNAGGESFPTETLAARVAASTSEILVVSGFDRMDNGLIVVTDDPYDAAPLHRGYVDMMNSYRHIRMYATAIDAYGSAFDSCSNEAIINGNISPGAYSSIIWFCGEESTTDDSFSATEQSLVESYLTGGGNLFVSGSEIGWDLDLQGNGVVFYNTYLKADCAGDDAGTYDLSPAAGSIFDGNTPFSFDDNSSGEYDANYPDRLTPLDTATSCLTYSGGTGDTAGVQYDGGDFKLVHFGFPFETITSGFSRNETMADILDFFGSSSGGPCSGALEISSFPYNHNGDTTSEARRFSGYSCPPSSGSESGPETIYRVVIDQPGDLTVTVTDPVGVDIDPHLLSSCSPTACLERADTTFTISLTPGTYYLVCDTWTDSGGTEHPGTYTLDVDFTPTPGDTTAPAWISDFTWDEAGERWMWGSITLDRLGGAESVDHYEVYLSTNPADAGSLAVATSNTFWNDPAYPLSGCWYYRVRTLDASGNHGDAELDRVVDNPEAVFLGSWSTGTTTPGHWGDDYRFNETGGAGSETAEWSFAPGERGFYSVRIYYPEGANRSTAARFTVSHEGGEELYSVNQQTGGGTWITLGTHWLEDGSTYTVVLDNAEPPGFVVLADAVRWTKQ